MSVEPTSSAERSSEPSGVSRRSDLTQRLRGRWSRRSSTSRLRASSVAQAADLVESPLPQPVLRRDAIHRRALACADLTAAGVAVLLCAHFLGVDRLRWTTLLAVPLVLVISKVVGLYDREELLLRKSTLDEVPALFQLATLYALLTWIVEPLLFTGQLDRWHVLELWVALFLLLVCARTGARALSTRLAPEERCLVIGGATACDQIRAKFREGQGVNATVVAQVPFKAPQVEAETMAALSNPEALNTLARDCDAHRVILAPHDTDADHVLDVVRAAKALGLKVSIVPRVLEVVGSSVEFDDVHGVAVLGVRRYGLSRSSAAIKRTFDIVGATCGLVVCAPLFAAIALAIRADSKGRVLFRQWRVGRKGERFQMLKFRTMVSDAEERKHALHTSNEADGLFKIADDPRTTRVGRFLRRSSLDELPQLVNVLRGDMSLVGPRPLVIDEDERVHGWHRGRLALTPGMTGRWQILGSGRIPLHEMVKLDYLYIANWTLWSDLKILLRTVPYVLCRRGW